MIFQCAIIGPTACGKSALAVRIAQRIGGVILSVDSLSVYRLIDIASAKPTIQERGGIVHFGIDVLDVTEQFRVTTFLDLYKDVYAYALQHKTPLIIVGGTGFYLSILRKGLDPQPLADLELRQKIDRLTSDLDQAYALLRQHAPQIASTIQSTDRYRITKALERLFATPQEGVSHPPLAPELKLYEIDIQRETLRQRIALRTANMLQQGLVDECALLEHRYGRKPHPLHAIGIAEVFDYFDGQLSYKDLANTISLHTGQLAKRQQTYNKTQFPDRISAQTDELYRCIINDFHSSL